MLDENGRRRLGLVFNLHPSNFTLQTFLFCKLFARHALRVAIRTLDEVNVVRAGRGTEGSVHRLYIEAAV